MRAVAKVAGVSHTTVSLALRNDYRLPEKTRQRVRSVANQMGYRPNPLISTLMSYRRMARSSVYIETLGYIVQWPECNDWRERPYMAEHFQGASVRAAKLGYKLEDFWVNAPGINGKRLSRILQSRGIRGLVIAPMYRPHGHLSLNWPQFASVAATLSLHKPDLHRVSGNHFLAVAVASRQLRRLGYKRISLALELAFDQRSYHGLLGSFLVYQYFRPFGNCIPALITSEWNEAVYRKWFQKHRPDAVIGMHGQELEWLRNMNLQIPRDIGYAALNVTSSPPGCAGVNQQPDRIGAAAVDLVVGQLHHNEFGVPDSAKVVMIEPVWQDGSTVQDQLTSRSTLHRQPNTRKRLATRRNKLAVAKS